MSKLPPGRYRAKILYHTMTENSADNPELRFAFLVYPDKQFPLPDNYKPTPLTIFLTITDATIGTPEAPGWVTQTLKHLGFTSTDLTSLDPEGECPFSFTGKDITVLGSEDTYRNKLRTRWNILRHNNESKPIATNRLRELSKRYEKTLATLTIPGDPADATSFETDKIENDNDGPYRERR